MDNLPVWPGSATFVAGDTPFGFYDNDNDFISKAPKMAKWCAIRLGYPLTVELGKESFFAAFEEAITLYGAEVHQWKIRENYMSFEGTPISANPHNTSINPNLGGLIRLSKAYGTEAGIGGTANHYKGSIPITAGGQNYDLKQWALANNIIQAGDSIEIKKIFHEGPPALVRFYDPFVGAGNTSQNMLNMFDFGNSSPAVSYQLMPLSFDLQRLQAIELNDQIRRSSFSFELINNQITLFPIPRFDYTLHFTYIKNSEKYTSNGGTSSVGKITNISEVPYNNPIYANINDVGKKWIQDYTLAICKEMLGYIRGKYQQIPVPGTTVSLNQADLLSDAKSEKEALLVNLREILADSSRTKQLENKAIEQDALSKMLNNIPMFIYVK